MELTTRSRASTKDGKSGEPLDDDELESFLEETKANVRDKAPLLSPQEPICSPLWVEAKCTPCYSCFLGCRKRCPICCLVLDITSTIFFLLLIWNFHAWALYLTIIDDTPVHFDARIAMHDSATCDMSIGPAVEKTVHVVEDINAACVNVETVDAGMCFEVSRHLRVRCLPTFVIIGFEKCSTTELLLWMSFHPNLKTRNNGFFPEEARYFESSSLETSEDLSNSWRDYVRQFPSFPVADVGQLYTFEKTPALAQSEKAARLLHELMPSAKLVVMVRNPTSRAYSHFQMYCKMDRVVRDETGKLSYVHKTRVKECQNNDDCEVMKYPCDPALFEEYVKTELSLDLHKDYSAGSADLAAVPNALETDVPSRILKEGSSSILFCRWNMYFVFCIYMRIPIIHLF
jgi:hypothetical protein